MPIGAAVGAAVAGGVASAAVGAIGNAIGGSGQSSAVSSGQQQIAALDDQARQSGQDSLALDRANAQPYISSGTSANTSYANLLGVNGPDAAKASSAMFQASPGYGYQVDQGLRAVDMGAASQGMLHSGATVKAEQTLGSNLANQDYQQYLSNLNGLSNSGLQGVALANQDTATYNNLLTSTTNNQTGLVGSAANNQASIYGNTVNGITGQATNLIKNGLYESGIGSNQNGYSGSTGASSNPFDGGGISYTGGIY